jgi:protein-tyrosine phosphatase
MMNGGVTRVFDFRGREERLSAPCVLPGAQVQSLSIEPSVVKRIEEHLDRGAPLSPPQMVAYMQQTYRDFVAYNTPRFAELFAAMLQSDAPLVFHCTAGKDRTGVAAALILLALGADKDVVMHDYLLTNMYLKHPPDLGASRLPPLARAVLYGVQADFLEAAFTEIDLRFGGLDAYLAGPLGLGARELGELRRCYLQS